MRQNIFKIMEAESWDGLGEGLRRFLLRLSLVERLSSELVVILAGGEGELVEGLRRQHAYIRFDGYGGAYFMHRLYMDLLVSKQGELTEDEKTGTYKAAAAWCAANGFTAEALNYYEKINDYESIVGLMWGHVDNTTRELTNHMTGIFERAPSRVFEEVVFFATMHLNNLFYLGRLDELYIAAEGYEKRFLGLPGDGGFRDMSLAGVYYVWSNARVLGSTYDDKYDFDIYYEKMAESLRRAPADVGDRIVMPAGSWVSAVGSARAGAPMEFVEAMARKVSHVSPLLKGVAGADDLCRGELRFYQNDMRAAEPLLFQALETARRNGQFEIMQRSLFYIMRLGIVQGDRAKVEQTMFDLKLLLDEERYARRFITYDITMGWYHCMVRQADMVADWLKGDAEPYGHAFFLENFGNQVRLRYYYLKRNYMPLLAYIREMRQRESILYGRVELLAAEACVRYQMKNKAAAWSALRDAYKESEPNDITMPFIELGKDMRTLAAAALREGAEGTMPNIGIPRPWLESIKNKATTYAKSQSMFITGNKAYNGGKTKLSAREQDVLRDLYHGFSQSEIAGKRSLSVNTIKMITKCIYDKLSVHKISDLVRVAAEQGLV
jgi:LuxR family maltose regulon positive regulatory protein